MPLTDQEFEQTSKALGIQTPKAPSAFDRIKEKSNKKALAAQPKDEGYFKKIAGFIGGAVKSVGDTAMRVAVQSNPVTRTLSPLLPEKVNLPVVGDTSLRYSDNPGTALKQGGEDLMNSLIPGGEGKLVTEGLEQSGKGLAEKVLSGVWKGAKTGATYGTVSGGVQGAGKAIEEGKDAGDIATEGLKGAGYGLVGGGLAGGLLGGITGGLSAKTNKNIDTALEAVKPDMKGKTLVNHYLQDFGASTQEAGLFKPQSAAPSEQVTKVATNLQDVLTSKKPLENLKNLGVAMEDTEAKLGSLLEADKTPVVKQHVVELVQDLKKNIPREFQAIKDQKNVFNHVIDYADELLNGMTKESTGSLKQLREARSMFDAQAKREFPSAFKNGVIDVSTPGGRAIKLVRDTINDHLYEITPQGSELQRLIGREADIFKAAQNIAPKVAKNEGKSILEKLYSNAKKHPIITAGAAGYGAYQIGKNVVR